MATNTSRIRGWVIGLVGAALAAVATAAVPVPDPFGSAERGRVVPPPASDSGGRRRDLAGGRVRRRVLLGRAGRLPARHGRDQRGLGLRRRQQGQRPLRDGGRRRQRSRRGRADHVRSAPGQLRRAAADLLLGRARPDPAQSPGAGRRDAVPVDDLPGRREAGRGGEGLHRAVERRPRLRRADRHDHRAGSAVLSGRGLPPGLPHAASWRSPTSRSTTCPRSAS